jgi:hypothetical protein
MGALVLAGLAVLVIGDNHMVGRDNLLTALHDGLTGLGAVVDSYGMCGATPEDWVLRVTERCGRTERHGADAAIVDLSPSVSWNIGELIDKHQPRLVIVETADTLAGYGSAQLPRAWAANQVGALVGQIRSRHVDCAWVGPIWGREAPPYYKTAVRVRETAEFLAQTVAPCRFIDSTAFAAPAELPTADWQRLTPAGYKRWGYDIAEALQQPPATPPNGPER